MELRVEDLRKSYGGTAVLQGVSFTAEIGLTRVTGSSGIGKTTLLRILLGLESPDGGATNAGRFRWAAVFQEDRLLEQLDAAGNRRFMPPDQSRTRLSPASPSPSSESRARAAASS